MSYDFRLFPARKDEDPLATARQEEEEFSITHFDPEREAIKREVASALIAINPAFEPFQFDYAEIAKFEGTSIDEASLKHRHIELNGPDNGNGIQITIYEDEAALTVPYWHEGAKA
jgi:hypothetical protein